MLGMQLFNLKREVLTSSQGGFDHQKLRGAPERLMHEQDVHFPVSHRHVNRRCSDVHSEFASRSVTC